MMTVADISLCSLAALLNYPGEDYLSLVHRARREIGGAAHEAGHHVIEFLNRVQSLSSDEVQELYTRTFDLNPACVLEVGWQLFGDEYKRGEFLVKMRQLLAEHHAPASKELPDHLPGILSLLPMLEREEAELMVTSFVLPALGKMLAALQGKDNPYEELLKAVQGGITAVYAPPATRERRQA